MKLSEDLGRVRQQLRTAKKDLIKAKKSAGRDTNNTDSDSDITIVHLKQQLQETVELLEASQEAVHGDNQVREQNVALQQQTDRVSKQLKEVTSQAWQSRQQVDSLSAELRRLRKFEDAARMLEGSQAEIARYRPEIERLQRELEATSHQLQIATSQPGVSALQSMLEEATDRLQTLGSEKEFHDRQWAQREQRHTQEVPVKLNMFCQSLHLVWTCGLFCLRVVPVANLATVRLAH